MAKFILVHGACHGAWCWRDLLPLLTKAGHSAVAIDLPSHGEDMTPIEDATLDSYTQAVIAAIDRPVILVGHSLAGITISSVAERVPDLIARLVYLCAWLPNDGMSAKDMRTDAAPKMLSEAILPANDRLSTSFDTAKVKSLFYHDCPPGTLAFARARLRPEPTKPSNTPVATSARFQSVPRSYIRCMNDRAIPPENQVAMSGKCKPQDVYDMDCAHSPFFAQPDRLAKILLKIVEGT